MTETSVYSMFCQVTSHYYKMWMCYVKDIEITDLKSGVQYLHQKFSNLQFDAEHEAVYGMGAFHSEEECNKIAKNYEYGCEVCDKFLQEKICVECLVENLMRLNLEGFLHPLKDYLCADILDKLNFSDESDSDETNCDESECVETESNNLEVQ